MEDLLTLVEKTLDEKQAAHITVIDMRKVSPFSDYYVICTARNVRHANALCDFVEQAVSEKGYEIRTKEGDKNSTWILLDLNEVVVHIFTEETRSQYRLEALWADQPQMEYSDEDAVV